MKNRNFVHLEILIWVRGNILKNDNMQSRKFDFFNIRDKMDYDFGGFFWIVPISNYYNLLGPNIWELKYNYK